MTGWKSKLGAALVAVAGLVVVVAQLCDVDLAARLHALAEALTLIGGGVLGAGVAHKIEKAAQ